MREIRGEQSQLIWYQRENSLDSRASDYLIAPVDDSAAIKGVLQHAYGIRGVVQKLRRLYLYHNVRIHLDEVAELGEFLEFEAVLTSPADKDEGHGQVEFLRQEFRISAVDLIADSYSDMLFGESDR